MGYLSELSKILMSGDEFQLARFNSKAIREKHVIDPY